MADLPISGLPAITVPNKSYLLAAVSASVTSQMTLSQVAAAISSSFTASQAISASYATSASYEINYETSSSYADTASFVTSSKVYGPFGSNSILSASYAVSASNALSSSYSTTASYWIGSSAYTTTGYLTAYHTASLTVPLANTPYTTSFSTTDFSYGGITISGSYSDKIKIANEGVYNIQFSAQVDKTNSSNANVFFWMSKNGTDIPWTNTDVAMFGGSNEAAVAAWNFFVSGTTGDYFQLMFGASNDNIVIETATPAIGPAIPSLILTVNRVG